MRRTALVALSAVVFALPVLAQAPAGWKLRADRSTSAADPDAPGPIRFSAMGSGFHAINPQAAVYWNPSNIATGEYTLKASFKLVRPSGHTNYYGLVFGGSDLEGPAQTYLYFMVAQDASWLIKRRNGDASTQIVAQNADRVVQVPEEGGSSTNALEVRVTAAKIDYVVNGVTVHSAPRSGLTAHTDGIYGLRVNHQLEVHVDGLAVTKPALR